MCAHGSYGHKHAISATRQGPGLATHGLQPMRPRPAREWPGCPAVALRRDEPHSSIGRAPAATQRAGGLGDRVEDAAPCPCTHKHAIACPTGTQGLRTSTKSPRKILHLSRWNMGLSALYGLLGMSPAAAPPPTTTQAGQRARKGNAQPVNAMIVYKFSRQANQSGLPLSCLF